MQSVLEQATTIILKQTLKNNNHHQYNNKTNNNNNVLEPNIESLRWFACPHECYTFLNSMLSSCYDLTNNIDNMDDGKNNFNLDNFFEICFNNNMHLLSSENVIGPTQPISVMSSNTAMLSNQQQENNNNDATTTNADAKDNNNIYVDHT